MNTFKRAFSVFILILLSLSITLNSVYAEAVIQDECRATNIQPGYCGWCCIQTMSKHQKIKEGYNIVESRKSDPDFWYNGILTNRGSATDEEFKNKLNTLKIKFKNLPTGSDFRSVLNFIKITTVHGQGCLVVVAQGLPTTPRCHAITVVDINEEEGWYRYIDSNDPIGLYQGQIEWLHYQATGYVLSIYK